MKQKGKVKVVQDKDETVTTEIIATAIRDISGSIKAIRSGRLKESAVVVLLNHSTGVPMVKIKAVLNGIEDLERTYLK